VIVKAGGQDGAGRLPKVLVRVLGDEVLLKLWNEGTENRATVKSDSIPRGPRSILVGSSEVRAVYLPVSNIDNASPSA